MKVKELIEELQKLPQDLEVVLEVDHGQTRMASTWVGIGYVENKEEYMMESIADHDVEAYPTEYQDVDKVVVIQAY